MKMLQNKKSLKYYLVLCTAEISAKISKAWEPVLTRKAHLLVY